MCLWVGTWPKSVCLGRCIVEAGHLDLQVSHLSRDMIYKCKSYLSRRIPAVAPRYIGVLDNSPCGMLSTASSRRFSRDCPAFDGSSV